MGMISQQKAETLMRSTVKPTHPGACWIRIFKLFGEKSNPYLGTSLTISQSADALYDAGYCKQAVS